MGKYAETTVTCKRCGTSYPANSGRCPNCHGTGTTGIVTTSINPLIIIKPVIWVVKLCLWIVKKICKMIFSKTGFTICTLGLGLLTYKLLNKIYGD